MKGFIRLKINGYHQICLLLFCFATLLHANLALAQIKAPHKKDLITLQIALNRLENYYHIRLVYIDNDIPNLHVMAVAISGDFKADLNLQIKNSGLKATRISDQQFVLNKRNLETNNQVQENWIEGMVYSANENIPLDGATVSTQKSGAVTHTDQHGFFKIRISPNESITVAYVGLKQETLLPLPGKKTNIYLSPEQVHLNNVEIFSNTDFIDYIKKSDHSIDLQKAQLNQTGRINLPQSLNFSYSNINVGHYAIDNVASYLDPVRLNGQDADYITVLIEGKKRHLFSGLNLNYTTGMGYSGVDLEAIPQNLLQRIEVLPSRKSILYGSEAVGGVINFKFDTLFRGFNFRQHTGITTKGDGLTTASSLRYATTLPWSQRAFLDLSLTYKKQQSTNRSNAYGGLVYRSAADTSKLNKMVFSSAAEKVTENKRLDDSTVSAKNFNRNVSRYGDGENSNLSLWYNTSSPTGRDWKLYSFGGISSRNIRTYGFYRFPNDYKSASPLYPDGYLPEDPASLNDVSITAGLSKKTLGYDLDFSSTYGRNSFNTSTENTVNPSLGALSPTSFKLGQTIYSQSVNDVTFNKYFKWHEGLHLSTLNLGGQYINSSYQIKAGDEGSYLDANPAGIPTAELKLSGTNGHLGFSPSNAVNQQRNELSLYGLAIFSLDKYTEATIGLRSENTTLFKPQVATSFDIRQIIGNNIILHAAYHQSTKIPSLQQLYFSQTQYQFFPRDGISDIYKVMQISSISSLAQQLGLQQLKPENVQDLHFSSNFNKDRFSFYTSYNRIHIKNRLMVSGQLSLKNNLSTTLLENSGIDAIQYFKNIPSSTTQVFQVIGGYHLPLPAYGKNLVFQADLAYNRTRLNSGDNSNSAEVNASNRTFKGIVEDGQPKLKIIGKVNYQSKGINIFLRDTYFGPVWYRDSEPALDQHFGGKVITDLGASWNKSRSLIFTMAFNNLFNVYPDKVVENSALNTDRTFGNQIVYSRQTSQFGIYGTYISLSIDYRW